MIIAYYLSYIIVGVTLAKELYRLALDGFRYISNEQTIGTAFDFVFIILVVLQIITGFTDPKPYMAFIRIILRGILISGCLLLFSCCISKCDYSKYLDTRDRKYNAYVKTIKSRRRFTLVLGIACCMLLTPNMGLIQLLIFVPLKSYVSHSCQLLVRGMKSNSIPCKDEHENVSKVIIPLKSEEIREEQDSVNIENTTSRSNLDRRSGMID